MVTHPQKQSVALPFRSKIESKGHLGIAAKKEVYTQKKGTKKYPK